MASAPRAGSRPAINTPVHASVATRIVRQAAKQGRQLADARNLVELQRCQPFGLDALVRPRHLVRHVDRLAAGFEHGQDVGSQRVADHRESCGRDPVAGHDAPVGARVLLGDDLDAGEVASEARARELRLLVEQVALRQEDQPECRRELLDCLRDAVEELDQRVERISSHPMIVCTSAASSRPPVISIAVSIIDRTKPLTP